MNIEVERRALVDEATLRSLAARLKALGAEDIGDDDTETAFYLTDGWQAKVQRRLAPGGEAKIAWKSGGNDGSAERQEIELPIAADHIDIARRLMTVLAPQAEVFETVQKRHDYRLDGVGVALKFSEDWQYHVELDMVVDSEAQAAEAGQRIEAMADRLGIKLLTPEEERAYVEKKIAERQRKDG